jgi:2-haloacid dehalogenase
MLRCDGGLALGIDEFEVGPAGALTQIGAVSGLSAPVEGVAASWELRSRKVGMRAGRTISCALHSGFLSTVLERRSLMDKPEIIVFDVNETLLDLDAVRPIFDRIFQEPAAMRLWFANLITYSEALTLAGVYVPFTDIGGAALRMLASTMGKTIADSDTAELTDRFASMPPHPEVPGALRRLCDHGFRLFTLTDNTLEISGRQLETAGVIDVFERRFSVDETVKRHKPAQEAYHFVAKELGADPAEMCLVACHVWDTVGALSAGWQAALILRPWNAPLEVGPQPNYIGDDLNAIAEQLMQAKGS